MLIDYVLLLFLFIVPIFYRYNQWLYLFENFDYNFTEFKNFLFSHDAKVLIFHFWFVLEFLFLLMSIFMIFHKPFEFILYNMFFYFLVLLNIYYFWKIFRWKIKLASCGAKNYLIGSMFLFVSCISISYLLYSESYKIVYLFIVFFLLFLPIICLLNFYIMSLYSKNTNKQQ